jgi:hypothetical protein
LTLPSGISLDKKTFSQNIKHETQSMIGEVADVFLGELFCFSLCFLPLEM